MARYTGPKHRLCRREGSAICGLAKCPVIRRNATVPGQHGANMRRKPSEYSLQLREKQKAKRTYGVLEKQFRRIFTIADRSNKPTGAYLLSLMVTRLDNVIYRMGLANTRPFARQIVSHGHVLVDGKKVNIPSYQLKAEQVVTLSPKFLATPQLKQTLEDLKDHQVPVWLEKKSVVAKVKRLPEREEIKEEINEQLIVEFYSR